MKRTLLNENKRKGKCSTFIKVFKNYSIDLLFIFIMKKYRNWINNILLFQNK